MVCKFWKKCPNYHEHNHTCKIDDGINDGRYYCGTAREFAEEEHLVDNPSTE